MESYFCLISGGENTSTFTHIVSTNRSPGDLGRIPLGKEFDGRLCLSIINDERVRGSISGDSSRVLSMDGIVLEHIGGVIQVKEGVVDGDGHNIARVLHGGTADETTDTAESVDSDLDSHVGCV